MFSIELNTKFRQILSISFGDETYDNFMQRTHDVQTYESHNQLNVGMSHHTSTHRSVRFTKQL